MKALFFSSAPYIAIFVFFSFCGCASSQDQQVTPANVENTIISKRFVFKAQTATPLAGRLIQLNFPYDLRVTPDSVVSYLPYYGRAYSAPISTEDAGLSFTSTRFSYDIIKQDKDKQDITIVTSDQRDNYKLFFTVYSNGEAQLQVTSNNRQAIRFDGNVVEKAAK